MLDLRVILQPTDYSETARIALRHASRLARQQDAEVHVLHVDTTLDRPMGDDRRGAVVSAAARISEAADNRMREWIEQTVAAPDGLKIRRVQARGTCVEEVILRYAASERADLIMMGHSREGLRRLLLGSVADAVVRQAAAPVYVTGSACPDTLPSDPHLLVPIDFSAESLVALSHAKALAASMGGEMTLLHVVEPAQTLIVALGDAPEGRLDRLRARAVESLARADQESGYADVPTTYLVEVGYPSSDIVAVAEAVGADLIVLSTHGKLGNWRLPLGNVAERVVRTYRGAVLLAKPYGRSLLREDDKPPVKRTMAMTAWQLA